MNEEKTKIKRGRGRPKVDPNRKCFSFYCTKEEIEYLRNLLKRIRIMLNAEMKSRER